MSKMDKFKSFLHALEMLAPVLLPRIPGVSQEVADVAVKEMIAAEGIASASTGPERKTSVMAAVAAVPGVTQDEQDAISAGIDTTIAVVKDIHARHGAPAVPAGV